MVKQTTKKRRQRAGKRIEQQQLKAAASVRPLRFPAEKPVRFSDGPDDVEGGAGVREPRRPRPDAPAGALALELPVEDVVDVAR